MKVDPKLLEQWCEECVVLPPPMHRVAYLAQRAAEWGAEQERVETEAAWATYDKRINDLVLAQREWFEKTEWVQSNTLPAKYLGMHRADGMTAMIDELIAERDALLAKRKPLTHQRKCELYTDADLSVNAGRFEYYMQGIEDAECAHGIGGGE